MKHLILSAVSSVAILMAPIAITPAAAAEYEWTYLSNVTAGHKFGGALSDAFKRIEEKSDGKLKITLVSFNETPHKSTNALAVLRDGLSQMTEWIPAYYSGTYPILGAPGLPFLTPDAPDAREAQAAADRMWDDPAMKAEAEKIIGEHKGRELGSYYYEPMNFYFNEIVEGPDGMDGMRVRIFSPELAALVEKYGATPVNLPSPDVYSSLQRGMLDGVITSSGAVTGLKWHEQLKAAYRVNMTMIKTAVLVNTDALDELPADLQELLIQELAAASNELREVLAQSDADNHAQMKDEYGFTVVDAGTEQYAAMRNLAKSELWPAWAERTGGNAGDVLDSILKTVEE